MGAPWLHIPVGPPETFQLEKNDVMVKKNTRRWAKSSRESERMRDATTGEL